MTPEGHTFVESLQHLEDTSRTFLVLREGPRWGPRRAGHPPHFFDGRSRGGAARARTGRVAERMAVAVETPDVELGSGLAGGLRVC